jgi:hypothetical protein
MEGIFKYTAINGVEISGPINQLKEWADEINNLANESGNDISKHLHDTLFAIEVDYQNYHGLDEHNYDIVH